MPRFSIVPTNRNLSSAEITAIDPGAALNLVDRMKCGEADVLKDGEYLFSVRVTGPVGLWTIFQR